ncbi:ATP-dependent RNA helicase, putative [Babesia bigemina]|uniref:RNA helicase n=1 Tax=Babesia bigemina TaxID=5866 RepID=A0A061D207_BABBI|nr:ATP-dependent RNA helicase, putative [Babesia bigemina]CDR94663.1 ATP-dependent RNA helicase, putative [Babesia bigemina]|eukprot:XP_012766849.1 ATP-dependent RNA helicase, putative [Babesia bigemina]
MWAAVRAGQISIRYARRTKSYAAYNIDELYNRAKDAIAFTEHERILLNNALLQLSHCQEWSRNLYAKGVPPFLISSAEFRDKFIRHVDHDQDAKQAVRSCMISAVTSLHLPADGTNRKADSITPVCEAIILHLTEYVRREMPQTMLAFHGAKHLADLTNPLQEFPPRPFRRRVIAHLGPPNSGKTHEAHRSLCAAKSGAYCSPLRLLAWEMRQRLSEAGLHCSLLTGQENVSNDGDTHLACTVEMTPLHRDYGCAVIDEMQMVGDANRGFAWTRAFLGIRAPEVHICGSISCYTLAKSLCDIAGDSLEVTEHARLGQIAVIDEPMSIDDLQPGDCVVCFSRGTALRLVENIERSCFKNDGSKPLSTAVVYGSLPPETRTRQIDDFNSRRKCILVASDVIGMGVNVRIKRVIFHTVKKFDGMKRRRLTAAEVQQIAGRAGRYGLDCGNGYVGCMRFENIGYVKRMMEKKQEQLERAVVAPSPVTIAAFADAVQSATDPPATLAEAIQMYRIMAQAGGTFELCDVHALIKVAKALERIELPTQTLVEYLFVPLGSQPALQLVLRSFALSHAVLNTVKIQNVVHTDAMELLQTHGTMIKDENNSEGGQGIRHDVMRRLEMLYQILDAYAWLWHKFPDVYVDYHAVVAAKANISTALQEHLVYLSVHTSTYEENEEDEHGVDADFVRKLIM